MQRHLLVALVASLLGGLVLGCSQEKKAASDEWPQECIAIINACHDVDPGSGPIHDCHELAEKEGVTATECGAKQSDCLSRCASADAGADAGGDEHSHDHEEDGHSHEDGGHG